MNYLEAKITTGKELVENFYFVLHREWMATNRLTRTLPSYFSEYYSAYHSIWRQNSGMNDTVFVSDSLLLSICSISDAVIHPILV